jgi:Cu/Ag efflux protein CusF
MNGHSYRSLSAIFLGVVLSFALASALLAGEQFAGEVLKVDVVAKKLTVKKPDGNRFTFIVEDATSFAGSRQSLKDLTQGDKVTVDFQLVGGQYKALKIVTP